MTAMRIWPGRPSPPGATIADSGVNFTLFSEHATKVELCLFGSPDATLESHRIALPEKTNQVWHGCLPDVKPGQVYGYRVHGPFDPARGHRFNPRKVLLDPYAKAIARDLRWDNAAYYRLAEDRSRYVDFTGCGNSLNVAHPRTLQLIMDSLRYWVQEMRVDGFRFDLASALARELWEVDRLSTFFDIIHQDPILSEVKLIAEPWDLGPSGYQVGNFPVLWTEWNGIRTQWPSPERKP